MRGLAGRLLLGLATAALVGAVTAGVTFLLGSMRRLQAGGRPALDAPFALVVLALAAVVFVLLSLAFLRRSVLRPVARLTRVVEAQELDALTRLAEPGADDDLSQLGHAILALSRRIGDDRARIAAQLEELRASHHALADAQRELVRAERLAVVGQLAAGLAHEVGNPLAVLSGFVEMLRSGTLGDTERSEALARMASELARIQTTLRGLLDFARAPAAAPAGPAGGDLGRVLDHVRALMTPQLRGATLELPAADGALPVAVGDDALTQLLLNLLLNALDAAGRGGRISLVVEPESNGRRVFHVDDSGPGVPPELRGRIFEPFFTTKPSGRGTGLGLSVCERIIAAAGGDLRVGDGPLGGARFTVSVPVEATRPPASARDA